MTKYRTYIHVEVDEDTIKAKRDARLKRIEERQQKELAVRAELIPLLFDWEQEQVKRHGAVVSRHIIGEAIGGDWLYEFADGKSETFSGLLLEGDEGSEYWLTTPIYLPKDA